MDQSTHSTLDASEASMPAAAPKKSDLKSFLVRAASGLIYAGLFIGCLFFGTLPTTLFVSAMSWLCCFEFFRMMRLDGKVANEFIGLTASILFPIASMFGSLWVTVLFAVLVLALGLWYVYSPRTRIADVAVTAFGPLYTGFMLSAIVLLREQIPGFEGALLSVGVCASLWVSDSFAQSWAAVWANTRWPRRFLPRRAGRAFLAGSWAP